eukprot:c14334_g1_i1 orf=274-642(+)
MDSNTVDENNIIHCPSGNAWMATLEDSIQQNKLVVTMYYASWSDPSKVMYDTMAQLTKVLPDVMFSKLDIEEAKDITARMAVRIVPTLLFVKGGKEVGRVKRSVSPEVLHQKILSFLQPQLS